ncbi:MAG: GH3 auxin-responsive promoter family protein [Candidatus Pacebacteria bacterium]|nr:GH3 auxin-responsive promoter family protein [Candidatus Paceibacterota bacterium]
MAKRNKFLFPLFRKYFREVEKFKKEPFKVQEVLFDYLLKKGSKTEWGKKYNYRNISSVKEFKNRVPISSYSDLDPYFLRLLKGENYLLWPEKIKFFAKSSGTTSSKSKFIPVSSSALKDCHYLGGKNLFASYFNQVKDSNVFKGQNFALSGSRQNEEIARNKYIADVSVIIIKNLPWWAKLRRSPKFSLASMSNWEEKIPKIAETISKQNITSLSGVPSWNLLLLKEVLKVSKKDNISEAWPNLELFVHGGVNFSPYRQQFKELISSANMHYLEVYNASEGFFAFQDDLNREDMLLSLNNGIFYEFMPMEELDKDKPRTLSLLEVELNKNYALVISTNAGLWRYLIGDTVKFTSLKPFRIIFSGRTKSFINAFGEELIEDNANKAIDYASQKTGAVIKDYTVAPVYISSNSSGRHQWLIEFSKLPKSVEEFTGLLDKKLKSLNSDYEAKRYRDMTLALPEIIVARQGLFYKWLKNNNKLGGQHKVPRLANDRKIIEKILALN